MHISFLPTPLRSANQELSVALALSKIGCAEPGSNQYTTKERLGRYPIRLYALLSDPLQIDVLAEGSVQRNLYISQLSTFKMPLPKLAEQRRIVQLLGALDDKIELNRRMNKSLERMARAIFTDWFVDFGPTRAKAGGRAPYFTPELWDLFPGNLDEEGKPSGWVVCTASDLFEFNPRESVKKGTNAPYLDMAALPTLGAVPDVPMRREYKSGFKIQGRRHTYRTDHTVSRERENSLHVRSR